jgi:large subunit ribosomal protein L6
MKKGVKEVERTVEVPEGVEVKLGEGFFTVKGPKGELRRDFPGYVDVSMEGNAVKFRVEGDRQRTAIAGTMAAHLRNMALGVTRGYEGRMKFVYSHFPVKVAAEGSALVIQNFLGERKPRRVEGAEGVEIKVQKDEIIITGIDKEAVGQTMARIERKTKVRGFDRRIFQDGIYMIRKASPAGGGDDRGGPKKGGNEPREGSE